MKTTQWAWISAAAIFATTVGCQGHSSFKRESNPLKGYSVAQEQGVKYVPGQKPPQPVDPDNNQYVCFEPLKVSVKGDRGERLMEFVEDIESTYEITVVSLLDDGNFDVKASGPAGIQLLRLSKKDNVAVYKLGWKPGKVKSSKGVDNFTLNLNYISSLVNKRCGSDIRVVMNLQVVRTQDIPTLTFEGLPQTALNVGDQFDFSIVVNDPASLPQTAPDLKKITFPASLAHGERNVISAVPAISCESVGKHIEGTTFKFNCKFETAKLDIKGFQPSETSAEAQFAAVAISKRGQKSTGPVTGTILLNLPKKEVAPDTQIPFGPTSEEDVLKTDQSKTENIENAEVAKPAPAPKPKAAAKTQKKRKTAAKKGAKA